MTELHPAANLFPMMSKEEFEGLKADIETNGQREPITYYGGLLLDGRNRLRACEELKVKPTRYDLPKDTDPVAWVLSHNFHRRHLDASQRSMVAARLANLPVGANQYSKEGGPKEPPSIEEAAKRMNVGISSVKRAKKIHDKGSAEVIAAVESGELKVTTAAEFVDEEPDKRQQTKIVRKGSGAVKEYITEPKPEPVAEPDEEPEIEEEPTIDEICEADNKAIESFCRAILKQFENDVPKLPWTEDSGRIDSAVASLKAGLTTLRGAKSVVCPACVEGRTEKGKCCYCKGHGYLPVYQAKAIPQDAQL